MSTTPHVKTNMEKKKPKNKISIDEENSLIKDK